MVALREVLFGVCMAIMMAFAALIVAAWPAPGRPVAALFPAAAGSQTGIAAIVQADGQLLDIIGRSSWIVSVGTGGDYAASLYRLGAWLVIDARMAALCFGRKSETAR